MCMQAPTFRALASQLSLCNLSPRSLGTRPEGHACAAPAHEPSKRASARPKPEAPELSSQPGDVRKLIYGQPANALTRSIDCDSFVDQ